MIPPDLVNGLFEFIGANFTFKSAMRVVRDRGYAGIYPGAVLFFTSWGFWNLYYYPHLGQVFSFLGGVALVITNVMWVTAMLWYGRKR